MRFRIAVFLVSIGLTLWSQLASAQIEERERGRGVYAEIFGNGLLYSFNYDQRFEKRLDGLGYKVGLSFLSVEGTGAATFPFGLNYLLGKNGKYFELGLGGTYVVGFDNTNTFASSDDRNFGDGIAGNMIIGYRSEPVDGGFLFRAALTPFFGSGTFWPLYAGVSFGYAF